MAIVLDGTNGVTTNSGTLISATTIGVGGATPSTSGAGITFPATQSASTDANTLDDYEEGTWTVAITTGGGSVTVDSTNNVGRYTKIGNRILFSFRVDVSSVSNPSGTLDVSLPFASSNLSPAPSNRSAASLFIYDSVATNIVNFTSLILNNSSNVRVLLGTSTTGGDAGGQMKAGTEVHIAGQYIAA